MQSYIRAGVRIANPMPEHMPTLDKVVARWLFSFNLWYETMKSNSKDLVTQIGSVSRNVKNDKKRW